MAKGMTVQDLIDQLSSLPEEQKVLEVLCTYDGGGGRAGVEGVVGVETDSERPYLLLKGE